MLTCRSQYFNEPEGFVAAAAGAELLSKHLSSREENRRGFRYGDAPPVCMYKRDRTLFGRG